MINAQEELKKLPARPGVYIMRDERDAIGQCMTDYQMV